MKLDKAKKEELKKKLSAGEDVKTIATSLGLKAKDVNRYKRRLSKEKVPSVKTKPVGAAKPVAKKPVKAPQ
jgi:hypothetical protein